MFLIVVVYNRFSGGSWSCLPCGCDASRPPRVEQWGEEMMVDPWRKASILSGDGRPSVWSFLVSCSVVMVVGSFCVDSNEIGHDWLGTELRCGWARGIRRFCGVYSG